MLEVYCAVGVGLKGSAKTGIRNMNQRFNPLWIGVIMYEERMTVGEFIGNLLRGDGWERPNIPVLLGRYLEAKNLDPNQVVKVKFHREYQRSSIYQWEVQGLTPLPGESVTGAPRPFYWYEDAPSFRAVPTLEGMAFVYVS
jgi:hypothetical protein